MNRYGSLYVIVYTTRAGTIRGEKHRDPNRALARQQELQARPDIDPESVKLRRALVTTEDR